MDKQLLNTRNQSDSFILEGQSQYQYYYQALHYPVRAIDQSYEWKTFWSCIFGKK